MVPAFFKTLIYLKKLRRDFSVVFRTFGSDIDNVLWEFNKFCSGEHPCFNGKNGTTLVKFDGTQGTRDLRIVDRHQKGLYYRYGSEVYESELVTGTLSRVRVQLICIRLQERSEEDFSIRTSLVMVHAGYTNPRLINTMESKTS